MKLNQKLRYLLTEKGWSRVRAAKEAGISRSALTAYTHPHKPQSPGTEALERLSKVFGVTADYLLDETKDYPPTNGNRQPTHIAEKELDYVAAGAILLPSAPITRIEITERAIILWPTKGNAVTLEKTPGLVIEGKFKVVSE